MSEASTIAIANDYEADVDGYLVNSEEDAVTRIGEFSSDRWGPWLLWLVIACWSVGLAAGFRVSVAMLSAAGFAIAVLGLRRPSLALLGLGLLCTLDSVMRAYLMTGGLLRWNSLNYWLLLFMLMALPALMTIKDVPAYLLLGLIALMTAELWFTPSRLRGILDLLNISAAVGLLAYFIRAAKDRRIWYWLGVVNGTLGACGGLVFFSQKGSLPRIDENGLSYFPLAI